MLFSDDFLQLEFDGGTKRVLCRSAGVDWPPPETLNIMGFEMKRESYSRISDKDRASMAHVCRGALYVPANPHSAQPAER
jgi:hypothetical protein